MSKGFTLIEIMIAVSVLLIGIVAIYSLVPHILQTTVVNFEKFKAIQLAREGLEIVRNLRDGNWLEQFADPSNLWLEGLTGGACGGVFEVDYEDLDENFENPVLDCWIGNERYLRIDDTAGKEGFYNYTTGPETKYKRKITINDNGDYLSVQVEIFWSSKTLTVIEHLYNWR